VAGEVVEVAAPPLAVTPVSEGMENQVPAHAAGAALVMEASLVMVTTKGSLAWPLAPTVTALVKVCEEPLVVLE